MSSNGSHHRGSAGASEGNFDGLSQPSGLSERGRRGAPELNEQMAGMHLDLDGLQMPRKPSSESISPFSSEAHLGPPVSAAATRLDASGRPLRLDTTPDGLTEPRQADYMSSRPPQREMRSPASAASSISPLDSASTINSPAARIIGQASELHTKILALQRTRSKSKQGPGERRRFSSSSSTSSQPRSQFSLSQTALTGLSSPLPGSQPSSTRTSVSTPDIEAANAENVLETDDESTSSVEDTLDKSERADRYERLDRFDRFDRFDRLERLSDRFGDRSADRSASGSSFALGHPFSDSSSQILMPSASSPSLSTPTAHSHTHSAVSSRPLTAQAATGVKTTPLNEHQSISGAVKTKFDPSTVISPTATNMVSSGSGVALSRASSFRSQQRTSLSERRGRGMRLDMSSGPAMGTSRGADRVANSLRSIRGNLAPKPATTTNGFNQFSDIVDKDHGCLKFEGKARVHAQGIEFSSGEKFNISMDKIEYISELGAGNYGTVNKVLHRPNNVLMAVKEIRLELEDSSLRQIIMELDVLHRCGMDNIIAFYGAFFAEGSVYICMEYMDGGSINKIYDGGIPEKYLRFIVRAVVRGLRHLKEEFNIIHRDVKPTNILCSTDGQVKLCDFGVSGNLVMSIARTNIGCQPYMAPERIKVDHLTAPTQPNEYTVESDIWSLGLSIIEMSQGKYPYPPETYANIFSQLSAIVEDDPPALDPTKYSPEACDFVAQLLNKAPAKRPRYGELLQHPWLQIDDCTPEELGAFLKERLVRAEPGAHVETEQPTLVKPATERVQ